MLQALSVLPKCDRTIQQVAKVKLFEMTQPARSKNAVLRTQIDSLTKQISEMAQKGGEDEQKILSIQHRLEQTEKENEKLTRELTGKIWTPFNFTQLANNF